MNSSPSLLERLTTLFLNERNTRHLLSYNKEVVERVLYLVETQKTKITHSSTLLSSIYAMEVERLEWLVKEYVITRLKKITNNFYLSDAQLENMADREKTLYHRYIALNKEYNVYVDLDTANASIRGVEEERSEQRTEFVGFYVLEDVGPTALGGEILNLKEGDFYIGSVEEVREGLLSREQIVLI